jgi:hypothetical protein
MLVRKVLVPDEVSFAAQEKKSGEGYALSFSITDMVFQFPA